MLTQAFSKMLITLNYQVNKDYIAEFLCVNKSKPELLCEGQCYLKKELKKAYQEKNPAAGQHHKPQLDITLFYQSLYSLSNIQLIKKAISYPHLHLFGPDSRPVAFFHPPQTAV
jgi:hypothetical protein